MSENIEYIDDYFQKQLNAQQRQEFEARCLSDKAFAEDVALYVSTREALRQNLLDEKKKQWAVLIPPGLVTGVSSIENETAVKPGITPLRRIQFKKWLSIAAAASLVSILIIYSVLTRNSAKDLIHEYVKSDLVISSTMDASRDSVQAGITAYNNKNYQQAIRIFRSLYASNPVDQQTLKYLGQAYLQNRNFDEALKSFEALSQRRLHSNAGPFLMGVTLMERNKPGDYEQARLLFQKVVDQNMEGKNQAEVWLKEMN
jgi:tetratricopeptide (TPR) repeat protein